MPPSVCLYSELESYSGSITHNPTDLARLVRDLKFACLFYDSVVLHRRNLWDHPLTLAAFEQLAPFVVSGRLWTSANEHDGAPAAYVAQKIQQITDFFAHAPCCQRDELNIIRDRWQRITPTEWKIQRRGALQSQRVWQRIDAYLMAFKHAQFKPLYPFLDWVQTAQAHHQFDKELILAKLGKLRSQLQPRHWAELTALMQMEFLRVGAEFNQAHIYPGASRAYLSNGLFEPLPFAVQDVKNIQQCAININLPLETLLALPSQRLFEISESGAWKTIRDSLLNNRLDKEVQQEFTAIFSRQHPIQQQLETVLTTLDLSPLILPAPWSFSRQALLGNAQACFRHAEIKTTKIFILDLACYLFYPDHEPYRALRLKPQHTYLLAVLAIAGNTGLLAEQIKQLFLELEWIDCECQRWYPHNRISEEEQELLSDRIYHLRVQINQQLEKFQLRISDKQGVGNWSLESDNAPYSIKLAGTAWEMFMYPKNQPPIPPGLSEQQRLIWGCLWDYSPQLTDARIIAGVLGKEWNEQTGKHISKAIYKLDKKLVGQPWRIQRSYSGQYVLLPAEFLEAKYSAG